MKLNPRIKHNRHKINSDISYPKIRLVGDNITVPGIYETYTAKSLARNLELDLVEISPNADPPVCKIVDYQKFLYDLKKKEKESINKSTLKEIKFTPNTAEHDMNFKINHIIDFLKSGHKVKALVFFKGREMKFKDQGELLILKVIEQIKEFGKIDKMPNLEGNKLSVIISPIKK